MDYRYIYYPINHKVGPRPGLFHHIHTNNIGGLWGDLKENIKRMGMFGGQEYAIARSHPHTGLSQGGQMDLIRAIQNKNF